MGAPCQEPGQRPDRRALAAWLYLGAGIAVIALGPTIGPLARQVCYSITGVSALAALIIGVRWHRPAHARPWWLLIAGMSASLTATVGWAVEIALTGAAGFPTVIDIVYMASYPLFTAALITWVRRDRAQSRLAGVIDAGIVVCGLAVPCWIFIFDPLLSAAPAWGMRVIGYLVYPTLDLVLVAASIRLMFSAALRSPAYLLGVSATVALLTGDVVYYVQLAQVGPGYLPEGVSAALWLFAFLAMGAAALHPSMHESTEVAETSASGASRTRMALYLLIATAGPALIAYRLAGHYDSHHLVAPLVLSTATTALLVARQGILAHLAHRRAVDLDNHTRALGDALRAQAALQQELVHQARHDALTGLGNRVVLADRLAEAVRAGHDSVLLMDLDGFKGVNDTLGHPAGDELLIQVADRLRVLAADDTLIRLGGDEFCVVLSGGAGPRARTMADAVVRTLARPFALTYQDVTVSASVGVHVLDAPVSTAEALRRADVALYAAKERGKSQFAMYEPALDDRRRVQAVR